MKHKERNRGTEGEGRRGKGSLEPDEVKRKEVTEDMGGEGT